VYYVALLRYRCLGTTFVVRAAPLSVVYFVCVFLLAKVVSRKFDLLAFAFGHFAFSVLFVVLHYGYFARRIYARKTFIDLRRKRDDDKIKQNKEDDDPYSSPYEFTRIRDFFPQRLPLPINTSSNTKEASTPDISAATSEWISSELWALNLSISWQQIIKLLLTEGEKFIMVCARFLYRI
jgi:hypothetical protein